MYLSFQAETVDLDQVDTSSHHTEAMQEERYENYRDTWEWIAF